MEDKKLRSLSGLLATLVLLLASLPLRAAAEPAGLEALSASLEATERAFAKTVADGDLEAFASYLADDAVFSGDGSGPALVGREAIVRAWSAFFQPTGPRVFWEPEVVSVHPEGEIGTSRGPFRLERTLPDGSRQVAEGFFFSVWCRGEEGWKIVLDGGTPAELRPAPAAWDGAFAGLEWLAGQWIGEGLGGRVEEGWSAPRGNAMIGTFRLVKNDAPVLYELFALSAEEGRLELRLKHFHADMKGWEEKDEVVTFPFLERGEGYLDFDGLRYARDGDDGLRIEIDFARAGGIQTETLLLRHAPR